jgi:hypothetical protein
MENTSKMPGRIRSRIRFRISVCLTLACLFPLCLCSRTAASQPPSAASQNLVDTGNHDHLVIPSAIHGVIKLDSGWRFHTGDDPAWADPNFDDSGWQKVDLQSTLAEQGIESYTGYGWYRLRLEPVPLPDSGQLDLALFVVPYSVGQMEVAINGVPVARTQGMTDHPTMYQSLPFTLPITHANADGTVEIAIRTWAGLSVSHGLLDRVHLGDSSTMQETLEMAISRRWGRNAISGLLAGLLFFLVSGLAATLYLAQRNHSEYLWLSLLCLSVTLRGIGETAWGLSWMPLSVYAIFSPWTSWLFLVATLEFVLRFTAVGGKKMVRGTQIGTLLLPITAMLHFNQAFQYLALVSQFAFCGLVAGMLFAAWRRGRLEAGVMLLPFLFAATADTLETSLDFLASAHWIPAVFAPHRYSVGPIEYSLSTVAYLVFLASLISVILYRFVHVSQEEQRSSAELEAARSVQAMLIPTALPSTKTFSLDSAYLPINGVGGDFFQALPLKDDSMLIVVGDVSGKGLQAAMNASSLVGALRNELSHDPATVLSHLNQVMLGASLGSGSGGPASFATCLCARIYPDGKMTIANAGHLSPYRDGRELELAPDLPLGVVPHIQYEQAGFQLKPGDRLTFLSDGVVEAANGKGELFGFERTQQISHEPARFIAQTAQKFGQTDDITVVSLYFVTAKAAAPLLQSRQ